MPATIAFPLGGNHWIIAGINEPNLMMIQNFVTSETSYDWIEARYVNLDWIDYNCRRQSTFTEDCHQGPTKTSQDYYNVNLVAVNGQDDCPNMESQSKLRTSNYFSFISDNHKMCRKLIIK